MNSLDNLMRDYKKNYKELALYALMVTQNTTEAEDILQDLAEKILTNTEQFAEATTVIAYYKTCILNLSKAYYKKKKRTISMDTSSCYGHGATTSDLHSQPSDRELYVDLKRIFDRLTDYEKQLLELKYVLGYQNKEIAAMMGSNANTVSQQLFRIRRKLEKNLELEGLMWSMLLIFLHQYYHAAY